MHATTVAPLFFNFLQKNLADDLSPSLLLSSLFPSPSGKRRKRAAVAVWKKDGRRECQLAPPPLRYHLIA